METQLKQDTGAAVSLLSRKMWCALVSRKMWCALVSRKMWCALVLQLYPWGGKQLVGVVGSPVMVLRVCTLQLRYVDLVLQADFVVVDSLQVESIIGLDFLEAHNCIIDLPNKLLQFRCVSVPLEHHQYSDDFQQIPTEVALLETLSIPPFSEVQTMVLQLLTTGLG